MPVQKWGTARDLPSKSGTPVLATVPGSVVALPSARDASRSHSGRAASGTMTQTVSPHVEEKAFPRRKETEE